ncbi:D-tagatose-bisphosphate aldolase, class II, non-catalytic subunit [Rhizobium sp. KVB221]|uniref:D-tagatose-bisphosphate aldolase, class II, non-catalytic subunit n=1 Tax=Rhizobium setariae TaxID=2801340 RepID=A0A936YSA8_9HYPH|nr:D-tagatose-bisphosphate aldolase, class II, non-catalytic subunit [Rhizobium setariae]MBL0371475.1 D-tagatose-bisphosphate aldolase, class II, non-catalytic subunit [Rhizobium setariae]
MYPALKRLAESRRSGKPRGITSVCSAHPLVIRAAIRRGVATGEAVLIEATCNQVNQDGGYTGMTPADFRRLVLGIANEEGLASDNLILGGDHLGPNPWKSLAPDMAMEKASTMIRAYVEAGFEKLHLDTSMGCANEPPALEDTLVAERAAALARIAETHAPDNKRLAYIIGTEVPVPGGADHLLDVVTPTTPEAAMATIAIHRQIFREAGLAEAFLRVIAAVVQPGVEFGHENVVAYQPEQAKRLSAVLDQTEGLVFEAHSTDYQSVDALTSLVRDGFPILKVGPGLTFALRRALYGLDLIASELDATYGARPLARMMEHLLQNDPGHWQGHYRGPEATLRALRHYSYSDRIRYYWPLPEAQAAIKRLASALEGKTIPDTLFNQFLPGLPAGLNDASTERILIAAVDKVLADYAVATRSSD